MGGRLRCFRRIFLKLPRFATDRMGTVGLRFSWGQVKVKEIRTGQRTRRNPGRSSSLRRMLCRVDSVSGEDGHPFLHSLPPKRQEGDPPALFWAGPPISASELSLGTSPSQGQNPLECGQHGDPLPGDYKGSLCTGQTGNPCCRLDRWTF